MTAPSPPDGRPTHERFIEAFGIVHDHIERRWGIPVIISDVANPFTGDLDGAEIKVDYDLTAEDSLFIIVHLFGHTTQWNTSEAAREIARYPGPWTEEAVARVRAYEHQACQYSMQLFHDAGVTDLDQWLSDFSACDFAYLEDYYRSGKTSVFRSFWRDGTPLLTPLPIPDFTPQKWLSRWQGIVV
ncbi:MAG TPA: hypothetical protein VHE35_02205 [Kofleriaceae bacterium]|nr:hypothetical protein [Kofleriaceae bacterium]